MALQGLRALGTLGAAFGTYASGFAGMLPCLAILLGTLIPFLEAGTRPMPQSILKKGAGSGKALKVLKVHTAVEPPVVQGSVLTKPGSKAGTARPPDLSWMSAFVGGPPGLPGMGASQPTPLLANN